MAETLQRDQNHVTVLGGITDDSAQDVTMLRVDPTTKRLLISATGMVSGTVTNVATGTGLTGGPITTTGTISLDSKLAPIDTLGTPLQSIRVNAGATALEYYTPSAGTGTVTDVSVVTANGISGSVATSTTTPAITLTLGAITPSSVTVSGLTASQLVATDGSKVLQSLTTATYPSLTELSYVKGVTSAIQTQLNAKGSGTVTAVSVATANGVSGSSSGGATPALTISLGAITPSTVNGNTITTGTGTITIAAGKTLTNNGNTTLGLAGITLDNSGGLTVGSSKVLTVNNTLTLSGTDSTTMTFPSTSATIARIDATQTFTGTQTFSQIVTTNNAITASGNAATVPITSRISTVTNNSAATLTITMTTTSAVDGQLVMVRILDFSAAAQTITWVNTENSGVTAPTTSNGSTTLPLTVGFQYNNATSKWRCIASA